MVQRWILSDKDEFLCSVVSGSYMIQFNYSNFKLARTQVFCFNSMTISYPLKPTFIKESLLWKKNQLETISDINLALPDHNHCWHEAWDVHRHWWCKPQLVVHVRDPWLVANDQLGSAPALAWYLDSSQQPQVAMETSGPPIQTLHVNIFTYIVSNMFWIMRN